jgi:hypothetical protein
MQLLLPLQMAASTVAICDLCDLFPKFSMQPPLVHEAVCANAIQVLSGVCQPLGGCTYDKQKQHFPSYVLRHGCVESRGQLMLQVLRSKHSDHHLEQKLRDVRVAQSVDKEYEQIL